MPDGEQASEFDAEPVTEPYVSPGPPSVVQDTSTALALPPVRRAQPVRSPVLEIAVTRNGEDVIASRRAMLGFWIGVAGAAAVGVALFLYLSPA